MYSVPLFCVKDLLPYQLLLYALRSLFLPSSPALHAPCSVLLQIILVLINTLVGKLIISLYIYRKYHSRVHAPHLWVKPSEIFYKYPGALHLEYSDYFALSYSLPSSLRSTPFFFLLPTSLL
jgi:hypothetical protein